MAEKKSHKIELRQKILRPIAPELIGKFEEDRKISVGVRGGTLLFKPEEVPEDFLKNYQQYEIIESYLDSAEGKDVIQNVGYSFRKKPPAKKSVENGF